MAQLLPRNIRTWFFTVGSVLLLLGCATHPRYGASPRKSKKCNECPKWNAVPPEGKQEYRVQNTMPTYDTAVLTNATRN